MPSTYWPSKPTCPNSKRWSTAVARQRRRPASPRVPSIRYAPTIPAPSRFRSLADLRGKTVGTLEGTIAYDILLRGEREHGLRAVSYEDDVHPYSDLVIGRVDAVLLDCMLPGRDGFSIARALREAGRFTPVLMLTARSRTEDVLEGLLAGADDYLPKPFELSILLVRLKTLLRRTAWLRAAAGASETGSDRGRPRPRDRAGRWRGDNRG